MNIISHPCMSHNTDTWETPQDLYDRLNKKYNFQLDPCCNEHNRKCPVGFDIAKNGLISEWASYKSIFMNPPYSEVAKWIQKAYAESKKGCTVVCLVKSCTDTKWWHEYALKAHEIIFIKGRVKFGGSKTGAPFPSCIIIFKTDYPLQLSIQSMGVKE